MKKEIKECEECNNTYIVATKSKEEALFCPFCGDQNNHSLEEDNEQL